jgi:hypothetical protein
MQLDRIFREISRDAFEIASDVSGVALRSCVGRGAVGAVGSPRGGGGGHRGWGVFGEEPKEGGDVEEGGRER